ncbi:MAG: hypothetical protein WCD35_17540 [Mycobacteriales bacterium]
MARNGRARPVSALHGLWLSVFGIDAALNGGGLDHQLGALALCLLFGGLVVSEVTSQSRPPSEPHHEPVDERERLSV